MKRLILICILFSTVIGYAQQPTRSFGDQGNGYYLNPIFAGDYPDPTILRDGNDYYMTHTSMNYYPGLIIWHSTDLVNWEPIAHALNKNVGEIWAPELTKYKGKYYIYFPAVSCNSTMVVTADQITGPWSDPVEMRINLIDPGHIVGEDGHRYLYFSDGHLVQLSEDGLSTVGEIKSVYNGWEYPSNWLTECFCLESPKLIRHDDYYYLISAQGGTAGPPTSHMAIAARSKSVFGPWENSPFNPIVHTYNYSDKWWSKGHASLVDTPTGEWYFIYHAFLNNFHTLGRMDLMEPVEWTGDGWFRIKEGSDPAKPIKMPVASGKKTQPWPEFVRGFSVYDWHAFDGYDAERYKMSATDLIIKGKGTSLGESNPLCFTAGHPSYTAVVKIDTKNKAKAGLMLIYNPEEFHRGLEINSDSIFYVTEKRSSKVAVHPAGSSVYVKLVNDNQTLAMYYSPDGNQWIQVRDAVDISPFNGNLFGNFRSLKLALYTYGEGSAKFSEYTYTPQTGAGK